VDFLSTVRKTLLLLPTIDPLRQQHDKQLYDKMIQVLRKAMEGQRKYGVDERAVRMRRVVDSIGCCLSVYDCGRIYSGQDCSGCPLIGSR
jgi:hypothetical protein